MTQYGRLPNGDIITLKLVSLGEANTYGIVNEHEASKSADQSFSYVPEPVARQLFDLHNPEHREIMAWRHPWSNKSTYQLGTYIWTRPLTVKDQEEQQSVQKTAKGKDGEDTTEEPQQQADNPVAQALKDLEAIHWREPMSMGDIGELIHGWSLVVELGPKDTTFKDWAKGPGWVEDTKTKHFMYRVPDMSKRGGVDRLDYLWPSQIKMPAENFDEEGWPKAYDYHYGKDPNQMVKVDATRCILMRTRPRDRTYQGVPFPEPGWDQLVWSYSGLDSYAWAVSKYGQTSISLPVRGGMVDDTQKSNIEDAMQEQHKRKPLVHDADASHGPQFLTPFTSLDPTPIMLAYAQQYGSCIGFPYLWLIGEKVGSVSGSAEDRHNITARLTQLQAARKPTVWRLLASMNPEVLKLGDRYGIDFEQDTQVSALEESQILQQKASSLNGLLMVGSVNEARKEALKWGPTEGGDEGPLDREQRKQEEAQQQLTMSFGDKKKDEASGKPKPTAQGRGESYLGIQTPPTYGEIEQAYADHETTTGVCAALRCSHHTIAKQRKRYEEEYGHEPNW